MRETKHYDLKELLGKLVARHETIEEIFLFGSRAYRTGSLRSDCDLLLKISDGQHVRNFELSDFAEAHCPALDFFVSVGGKAVSCANDSFVQAASLSDLVTKLDAIPIWSKEGGFKQFEFGVDSKWVFQTAMTATFPATSLPNSHLLPESWKEMLARAESEGLPTDPFMGATIEKVTGKIVDVSRRAVMKPSQLGQRGVAKDGWTVDLQSEYDCQNLFWTVVKPWLPGLGREEVTVRYEGQDKIADFNLFDSKLIIEFKFIDSEQKKREVLKDLSGLTTFYMRNANIRCLLTIVYFKDFMSFDVGKVDHDFTFRNNAPMALTSFISVP